MLTPDFCTPPTHHLQKSLNGTVERRVLDGSVAEPILNALRIVAGIGRSGRHCPAYARDLDLAINGVRRERPVVDPSFLLL